MEQIATSSNKRTSYFLIPFVVIAAIGIGWLTAQVGFLLPGLLLAALLTLPFIYAIFREPRVGIVSFIIYCFIYILFTREIGHFQYLYVIEGLLVLTWLAAIFHTTKQYDWSYLRNEICVLGAIWMLINVLELFNPAGSSLLGWMVEVRYHLLWILTVPLCMVIFNTKKDLNTFLILLICMSLLATANGIKQITLGLFPGESEWLDTYGYLTHLIWGELRVFSFYSDASQFGASQAQMFVIAFTLALGPFKKWKRILCGLAALAFLYGESISGTRGAIFTLFVGLGVVLLINKNLKVIGIALVIAVVGFCFLKFTFIGESHFEIRRMRSALNANDASFNIRLSNQMKLQDYLQSRPFGGGVGAMGYSGVKYNSGTYLASIPPDSYWVKVWAEYGIVGFVIWISMMMYIIGKSCGIVWNTKDRGLRFKLTALTAGFTGIIISSYGNEIMNMFPSSMILFVSFAFIFLGPKLDREAQLSNTNA
ncbi:O-antigen ligase [Rufibacter sp. XAAS-G3-1]|uniref:O-antigen ligase family protein n=1 Tax=Rufibacter sp. XAAS-G3-1 TaxID=2729134 RepID=UPI0015E792D4|nr:O-antigen ligase family protein [Rufibacter sp. XAAS-G3-1]